MKQRLLLITFVLSVLLFSCNNKPVKYKYYKCEIDSIQHLHWWAHYQIKVYYHFRYKDSVINDMYFDKHKYYIWSSSYFEGDSAIVGYNDSLKKSILLKRIYIRKNNYHVP